MDSGFECNDTYAFLHVFTLAYATDRIRCQSRTIWQIHTCSNSTIYTAQKGSFPLRISSVNVTKSAVSTFTEEILNGKPEFLCSDKH